MSALPEGFARATVELYGEAGSEWLGRLPALLADCARRWSLRLMPPFEPLTYGYAAPATRSDGADVVLKAHFPDREMATEVEALRLFDGHGAARLLDADAQGGALLLERLKPGTPLESVGNDQEATSIAVQVMRQLWRPVPPDHPFPTVAEWAEGLKRLRGQFGGGTGPFSADMVGKAEGLFAELIESMGEPVLLHGDLHHGNILAAERQPWLAIDPKGVVGEAAYEAGALLRNPLPRLLAQPHPERVLARRADQLAEEAGWERERVLDWGLAQAVLSGWWHYEDHGGGWEPSMECARLLAGLQRRAR